MSAYRNRTDTNEFAEELFKSYGEKTFQRKLSTLRYWTHKRMPAKDLLVTAADDLSELVKKIESREDVANAGMTARDYHEIAKEFEVASNITHQLPSEEISTRANLYASVISALNYLASGEFKDAEYVLSKTLPRDFKKRQKTLQYANTRLLSPEEELRSVRGNKYKYDIKESEDGSRTFLPKRFDSDYFNLRTELFMIARRETTVAGRAARILKKALEYEDEAYMERTAELIHRAINESISHLTYFLQKAKS